MLLSAPRSPPSFSLLFRFRWSLRHESEDEGFSVPRSVEPAIAKASGRNAHFLATYIRGRRGPEYSLIPDFQHARPVKTKQTRGLPSGSKKPLLGWLTSRAGSRGTAAVAPLQFCKTSRELSSSIRGTAFERHPGLAGMAVSLRVVARIWKPIARTA